MRLRTAAAAALTLGALASTSPAPVSAATLSAGLVYKSNSSGTPWNTGRWNTIGQDDPSGQPSQPQDPKDVYNLYWSTSPTPASPTFLNTYNDNRVNIAIDLTPGTHTWTIYGDSIGETGFPAGQHFTLNLYFDGQTGVAGAPALPGLTGVSDVNGTLIGPAATNNAMDLFGDDLRPTTSSLVWTDGQTRVTLVAFRWLLSDLDIVDNNYHGIGEYNVPDYDRDFIGHVTLRVEQVPEPAALSLLALAWPLLQRRRR